MVDRLNGKWNEEALRHLSVRLISNDDFEERIINDVTHKLRQRRAN